MSNRVFIAIQVDFLTTTQQTQNIRITFIQRRPNVFDVGPTLHKCYANILCLLGNLSAVGGQTSNRCIQCFFYKPLVMLVSLGLATTSAKTHSALSFFELFIYSIFYCRFWSGYVSISCAADDVSVADE